MAIAKVIFNNGITSTVWMDVTQDTVVSSNLLSGESATRADGVSILGTYVPPSFSTMSSTFTPTETTTTITPATGYDGFSQVKINGISSTYVGTGITRRSAADLTSNGAYITAPIGYYSSAVSKAVATATQATPGIAVDANGLVTATATQTAGYVAAGTKTSTYQITSVAGTTIAPTEASQLAVASSRFTKGSVYVGAISSTYVGTGVAQKSSADLIGAVGTTSYTVTAPAGYYSANATKNIAKYDIATPAISIDNTTGLITATVNQANAGYVPTGTKTSSYYLTVLDPYDITPTSTRQLAAASGVYTLGSVYVAPIPSAYIIPTGTSNITSNGTYDIASFANVSVGVLGNYQEKIAIPSTSSLTIVPDYILNAINKSQSANTFTGAIGSLYQPGSFTNTTATSISYIKINGDFIVGFGLSSSPIGSVRATFSDIIINNLETSKWHDFVLNGSIIPHDGMTIVDTTGFMHDIYFYRTGSIYTLNFDFGSEYSQYSRAFYYYGSSYIVDFCGNSDFTVYDALSKVIVEPVPDLYKVYESMAYNQTLKSSNPGVLSWIGGLTTISAMQFMGRNFDGNFIFSSASTMGTRAFMQSPTYISSHNFDFPLLAAIPSFAFASRNGLSIISASICSNISTSAFCYCGNLVEANFSSVQYISSYAFYYCNRLTSFNASSCKRLYAHAFDGCSELTILDSASFPNVSYISSYVFANCTGLSEVILSSCTNFEHYVFSFCSGLTSVDLPELTNANAGTFYSCYNLTNVSLPKLSGAGTNTFTLCSSLSSIYLPKLSEIGSYNFDRCINLSTIVLEEATSIYTMAFRSCYNLLSLYILASSVAALGNANAFSSSPISNYTTSTGGVYGSIYVPSSLYDAYSTATNWKTYSARFVSMTDAQISALLSSLG